MHDHASRTAAHIVNLYDADLPKHELYSRIYKLLLAVMIDERAEREGIRFLPSDN